MPQQQTLTTWFALNGANDVSPSGMADIRTGEPIYVGGLNVGDYFDLTEKEANMLSFTDVGILHAGRYRRVQVSPSATVANVVKGKIGLMPIALVPELNIVTTANLGTVGMRPVIFLSTIDPGKYGFIQELGVASVMLGGAATLGAGLMMNASGLAVAGTTLPGFIGTALEAGTANEVIRVQLELPVLQG